MVQDILMLMVIFKDMLEVTGTVREIVLILVQEVVHVLLLLHFMLASQKEKEQDRLIGVPAHKQWIWMVLEHIMEVEPQEQYIQIIMLLADTAVEVQV